jgi:hypothetical protein
MCRICCWLDRRRQVFASAFTVSSSSSSRPASIGFCKSASLDVPF